jgi:hypothetical protein
MKLVDDCILSFLVLNGMEGRVVLLFFNAIEAL